jgi:hypothetical protein
MTTTIQDDIKIIVDASKDNLFYICTDTGHLSNDQKFPIVLCNAEKSSIEDWDGIDRKRTTIFDVSISILEKNTKNQLVDDGKGLGGKTKESNLEYNLRMSKRRKQLCGIFERIIEYLTDSIYRFNYEVVSNVEFSKIEEQQQYGLVGMLCDFSVSFPSKKNPCCVDFDQDAIKNRQK